MSYSIVRVSKVKSGTNTTGIQKHVQRENNNYENEDIDHSKTYLNYDLVNNNKQNFNDLIDEKIEQNYTGKRKIRTDAVKHVDGLITSDNEFFNDQTPEDTKQFFEHAKSFLEEEYGKDNLLYATVHMDEKTPHMHYGVVPITTDGRLSAKEVVGNKKALTEFQDRFNEHVKQQGYELERGQSRQVTNAKHEQISQYKQKTEYHKQEYKRESQKTDYIKQKNDKLMEEYQKSLETLKKPLYIPFDHDVKKVGGLFSKEEQKTGNIIMSEKDLKEFEEKVKAAKNILSDYEYIKSGQKLRNKDKEIDELRENNKKLKEENKKLSKLNTHTKNLLELVQIAFRELERILGRNPYAKLINDLTENNEVLKKTAETIDKTMNPQYYQQKERENKQENRQRYKGPHL